MGEISLERLVPFELLDEKPNEALTIDHFPFVLGRHHDCDRLLEDERISRRHCSFFLRGDEVCVQDLGSLNGTRLNGKRIRHPQPVHEGDVLTLAGLSFQVHMQA